MFIAFFLKKLHHIRMFWTSIAILASVITAFQFIPQTRRAIKAKNLHGVSQTTFLIVSLSAVLWILHGIHIHDNAIIFANTIILICAVTISFMKFKKG